MNNSRISGIYVLRASAYRGKEEVFSKISIVLDDDSINIKAAGMFLAYYDWGDDLWTVNVDYEDNIAREGGYLA